MKRIIATAFAALLLASPAIGAVKTAVKGQSGNVAAASAVATLTGVALKTTHLEAVIIKAMGATSAACVQLAITGLDVGTINWDYCVGAGATTPQPSDIIWFNDPLNAASAGGNIVVTLPSLGTGNLNASVTALGYVQ